MLHELLPPQALADPLALANALKALPLTLAAPRPVDEAISSAGGVCFESLDDVERFISRVSSRPVARADMLTKGARYEAALRIRLDVTQLPKPFQVNALALREWQLASDWQRWSFTP